MQLLCSGSGGTRSCVCARRPARRCVVAAAQPLRPAAPHAAVVVVDTRSSSEQRASGDGSDGGTTFASRLGAAALAVAVSLSSALGGATAPPAAALAVAVSLSSALGGATALPAAAHGGQQHHAAAQGAAAPSTFSCVPLGSSAARASFLDLAGFTHPIATASPDAQRLFDQGLLLTYNFNRPEAARSFALAAERDAQAAMPYFGLSLAQGPYANKVWGPAPADGSFPAMTAEELGTAQRAARDGLALARAAAAAAAPGDAAQRAAAELRYLEAVDRLWAGLKGPDDPRFYAALERFAGDLEAAAAAAAPGDADAPALAAEARMNLSPWVHWKQSGPDGAPRRPVQPGRVVEPALRDIRLAMARQAGHPMAHHLLIHLSEGGLPGSSAVRSALLPGAGGAPQAFGFAALAEPSADVLSTGGPGGGPAFASMGHLTHMPSHTYLRVGRWHDAVVANQHALRADEEQAKRCVEAYMPTHNANMEIYAALHSGELRDAEALAARLPSYPDAFGPGYMSDGGELSALRRVQIRYARWAPLLAATERDVTDFAGRGITGPPPGAREAGLATLHLGRVLGLASALEHGGGGGGGGSAAAAGGGGGSSDGAALADDGSDVARRRQLQAELDASLAALRAAAAATPADPRTRPGDGIGIYSPGFSALNREAVLVAEARVDGLAGRWGAAAARLDRALGIDGALGYVEPPRSWLPPRQCLGYALLRAGRLGEAERAYARDLAELPLNPFSLRGLADVYAARGAPGDAERRDEALRLLAAAWAHADAGLELRSSCPAFSD